MNNSPLTYPPPRSLSAGSGPNLNQAPAVPLTIRCRASSPQTAKLIESPSSDPDHPSGAPPPQTSAWERVLGATRRSLTQVAHALLDLLVLKGSATAGPRAARAAQRIANAARSVLAASFVASRAFVRRGPMPKKP